MAELKQKQREEMLRRREEFKENTKNALLFIETPQEKPSKKRGRKRDQDYISDASIQSGDEIPEGGSRPKRRSRIATGDGDAHEGRNRRGKRAPTKRRSGRGRQTLEKGEDGLTARQRRKIVSKETISTSEDDSDESGVNEARRDSGR